MNPTTRSFVAATLVLLLLAVPSPAQIQGPGRGGKLTPQRLASLIRSMHQIDPAEQVMAVLELEKATDRATPQDLVLMRKVLLPELKRGIHRELGMLGRPKVAIRMQALHDRIINEGKEPQKPSDLATRARRLSEWIEHLAGTDESAKRRAMSQIRTLKALGAPALPAVKHLAAKSQDKITIQAANITIKWITNELWFDADLASIGAAPPEKVGADVIEPFLKSVVQKLVGKLDDKSVTVRTKTMRSLAGMKASAAEALKTLSKIALNTQETKATRRIAGLTIRAITTAQVEGAEWHKWKAKQDAKARKSNAKKTK